jgi:hypothetical protein
MIDKINKKSWSSLAGLKGWVERNTKLKVHDYNGAYIIIGTWMIGLDSGEEKGKQLSFTKTRKRTL